MDIDSKRPSEIVAEILCKPQSGKITLQKGLRTFIVDSHRLYSKQVDYGVWWTLQNYPGRHFAMSWLETTGELYVYDDKSNEYAVVCVHKSESDVVELMSGYGAAVDQNIPLEKFLEPKSSNPGNFLTDMTVERIILIHDAVSKVGPEPCPTGEQSVYYSRPIDELVMWLHNNSHLPPAVITAKVLGTIIQRQPFQDCNHRTAYATAMEILSFYNLTVEASVEEKEYLLGKIYKEQLTENEVANWISSHLRSLNSGEPSRSSIGRSRSITTSTDARNSSSVIGEVYETQGIKTSPDLSMKTRTFKQEEEIASELSRLRHNPVDTSTLGQLKALFASLPFDTMDKVWEGIITLEGSWGFIQEFIDESEIKELLMASPQFYTLLRKWIEQETEKAKLKYPGVKLTLINEQVFRDFHYDYEDIYEEAKKQKEIGEALAQEEAKDRYKLGKDEPNYEDTQQI